jgi:pimeloyl-ACP methyl ester carboxylesterase
MVEAVSRAMPRPSARVAAGLMLIPGRRMPERPEQRTVMARAEHETLTAGRHRIRVYRWGSGERHVLLVHGWSGRAAQFANVASRLASDATVVAFDAPAHGASRGMTADIGMWIDAIRVLDAAAGGFDLVIGHSFGGLAVRRASLAGLVHGRIVSISSPPSTDAVMQAYAAQVGLPDAVASGTTAALARRLGPVMAAIAMDRSLAAVATPAPLLVVHDDADRVVPPGAADAVVADWPGPTTLLRTHERGHNGILAAPEVLDAVAAFASEPVVVPAPR